MPACPECQQVLDAGARFCPACGAVAAGEAPSDPMIGATVGGKFKVERLIGQGGMGRVYLARHLTLDRPVVLKMLHRAFSEDPQLVQRFQREARAASRLNHPNSIAVLDFGAAGDGTLYMAMEYLGGKDLARLAAEAFPLPERRIVRIGAQILSALAEAHAQGIIHRDLKPENVMVEPRRDEPDFVKVLDFGIAKLTAGADTEPKLTQAGLVCGTPEFMSPEQARGADLDARSDLYSVGVILYQLATGVLPFQSDTPVGYLTKHLVEAPEPPRRRRPEVSERLDALIRRALEKEPARRFADAAAMREALLACLAPPPPRAQAPATLVLDVTVEAPEGLAGAAGEAAVAQAAPRARSRWPLVAAAAGALGVVAVGASILLGGKEEHRASSAPPPLSTGEAGRGAGTPAPAAPPTAPAPLPAGETGRGEGTPAPTAPPAARPPHPAGEKGRGEGTRAPDRARAAALLARGDAARGRGDLEGAIGAYLGAEAADPSLAEVQKRLGLSYQQLGKIQEAAARYRRYLATDPADAAKVRAILSTLQ